MAKIVVYATDKDGERITIKVGTYESVYDISIPVGHFAPDVILNFEEDLDEINEAHRKRKGWGEPSDSAAARLDETAEDARKDKDLSGPFTSVEDFMKDL